MNNKYMLLCLMVTFWSGAIAEHHGGEALQKAMTPKMLCARTLGLRV